MSFINNFNKNKKNKQVFKFLFYDKIKNLKISKLKITGRNNTGNIILKHRGGGVKKNYRFVDLNRNLIFFWSIPAMILSIEYDPNRSNFISLILYGNGFFSYILHINGLKIGKVISTSLYSKYLGYKYPLFNGKINKKYSQVLYFARSAGTFIKYLGTGLNELSIIILPSGKIIKINSNNLATFGENSNINHYLKYFYKAGQLRNLNKRPHVRGVAMNPIDHPHGGGEGKTSGGRVSVSAWGIYTKGFKRK